MASPRAPASHQHMLTMAGFSDLPEELMNTIAALASTPSLAALSQMSKQVHRIVQPHLYGSIRVVFENYVPAGQETMSPVIPLCRTFQSFPERLDHVRSMVVETRDPRDYLRNNPQIHDHIRTFAETQQQWNETHDIIVNTPHLEVLRLKYVPGPHTLVLLHILEGRCQYLPMLCSRHPFLHTCVAPHGLSKLKMLEMTGVRVCIELLYPLFKLPLLETLEIEGLYMKLDETLPPEIMNGWQGVVSPLKNIKLVNCSLDQSRTGTEPVTWPFVQHCPSLEVFSYNAKGRSATQIDFIIHGLCSHLRSGQLRKLEVSQETFTMQLDKRVKNTVNTALSDSRLEEVRLASGFVSLLSLPKTLRRLGIHIAGENKFITAPQAFKLSEQLRELARRQFRERLPVLERIELTYGKETRTDIQSTSVADHVAGLYTLYASKGVHLTLEMV